MITQREFEVQCLKLNAAMAQEKAAAIEIKDLGKRSSKLQEIKAKYLLKKAELQAGGIARSQMHARQEAFHLHRALTTFITEKYRPHFTDEYDFKTAKIEFEQRPYDVVFTITMANFPF